MAMEHPIRFTEKLARLEGLWSPRVIAEMNDYQFKIVRIQGDFVWHDHPETDETFIVLKGEIRVDFRDRAIVTGRGGNVRRAEGRSSTSLTRTRKPSCC